MAKKEQGKSKRVTLQICCINMECCEDDYYDYKESGRRYDSHHQIIPPDAPRQIDPNTIWSWIKLEFIPVGDFKMDPEMAARSKYYDEYKRTHNKQ
jgi:hypothetical protein